MAFLLEFLNNFWVSDSIAREQIIFCKLFCIFDCVFIISLISVSVSDLIKEDCHPAFKAIDKIAYYSKR